MLPTTRLGQAYYLTTDVMKLRYLFWIFYKEGLLSTGEGPRPHFLFIHWQMVMWLVEMFLDAIGVNYVTIRAVMTDSARRAAAKQFTSVESNCDVLLTSYQCGAHGLNLHGQCSRVVLLEPLLNMNTLFQAVGRMHRLGQDVEQKAWILFQEHSISRWIECNNIIKALPQLAASLHDLLKPLVVAATGDTADSADEDAQAELIQTHAEACLRQMLGQSSSRLEVQALDDLGPAPAGPGSDESADDAQGQAGERQGGFTD
jgi:hypothetical protein